MSEEKILKFFKRVLDIDKVPSRTSHGGEVHKLYYEKDLSMSKSSQNDKDTKMHKGSSGNSNIIDFSINMNECMDEGLIRTIWRESEEEFLKVIKIYPDSESMSLKKIILNYLNGLRLSDIDWNINEKNIAIGSGGMQIISTFCDAFIDKGDQVIIIEPTFSEYRWAAEKNKARIKSLFLSPNDNFSFSKVVEQISEGLDDEFMKAKVVFICSPNNPNGRLIENKELLKLLDITLNNQTLVFLDEAFIDFTKNPNNSIRLLKQYPNLFIGRSFTKFFSIPGLRIGYALAHEKIINYFEKFKAPWSVNAVSQVFIKNLLSRKDIIDKLHKKTLRFYELEREWMSNELTKICNLRVFKSQTNYLLVSLERCKSKLKAGDLKNELIKNKLLIRDCSNYLGLNEDFFRIEIKNRAENVRLLKNLRRILEK
ncbi:MAG: pyridoxal phosphate-dependent aminotransferase [Promethearchaeota archaeon]